VPLHFGLGAAAKIDAVDVAWPEGAVQRLAGAQIDRAYRVSRRDGLMEGLRGLK